MSIPTTLFDILMPRLRFNKPNGAICSGKVSSTATMPIPVKLFAIALSGLQNGEEEILFADNPDHRVYMRGVRDTKGNLIGYYERYEPPIVKEGKDKGKAFNQVPEISQEVII